MVARDRGCVSRLSPGQAQLLGLRAGLTGEQPRSALTVARVLHVTAQREAQLEHDALTALSRTSVYGCPGTPTTTSVYDAGFALLITPNGPFGAASAPRPGYSVASGPPAPVPNPTQVIESPRSGSSIRQGRSAAYPGAGVQGASVRPATAAPATNVLLDRLLLFALALAAVLMVVWYSRAYSLSARWGRFHAGGHTLPGRPALPAARTLLEPRPPQPIRSRTGIRMLPFMAARPNHGARARSAPLLAPAAHHRVSEPPRPAELPPAVSDEKVHTPNPLATESENTELGLWRDEILLYASERAVGGVDLTSAGEKSILVDGEPGVFTDTEGRLWIHAVSFAGWLRHGSEIDPKVMDVRARLAAMGWERARLTARSRNQPGKTRGRHYWRSPPGFASRPASGTKDTESA